MDLSGFKNKPKGPSLGGVRKVQAEVVEEAPNKAASKNMSKDIFMHKGKKYNAWQALGVPSGAGALEIKKAFAEKAQTDLVNKDFYFKAMKTLI